MVPSSGCRGTRVTPSPIMTKYRPFSATGETFSSAAGTGLANLKKEKSWRPQSPLLEADPPLHTRIRAVLTHILSPKSFDELREKFQREADLLVDDAIAMGNFDGMKDFAERYTIKVFSDAVGVQERGRENLLPYGRMVFVSRGPRNALAEAAFVNADAVRSWVTASCERERLAGDGLGAQIYAAVDDGKLSMDEASLIVRAFLSAGLETTVGALGTLLWCFATFKDQWEKLRQTPSLVGSAIEESLRYDGPTQVLFRTTTRDVDIDDRRIEPDQKIALFVGSANRDPRRWAHPDTFDIERQSRGNMAFGTGIHGCIGQALFRLESEVLIDAFVRKVRAVELTAEPTRRYSNVHRNFESLPVHIIAA
jgi:4-methoxybenzoate monooxygenase (O-demethylating)